MSEQEIIDLLAAIKKDVVDIKETLSIIPTRELFTEQKHYFIQNLRGGLRDREIRTAIIELRNNGMTFEAIAADIRQRWKGQPDKHPSKSAIHRFYQAAMHGRLRKFGIEPPIIL